MSAFLSHKSLYINPLRFNTITYLHIENGVQMS
jgi:hypothetical protein